MNKIVAIGDIHGHYDQLLDLYNKLITEYKIDPETDTFVFLGDYVDGGSQTKEVLDKLRHWKELYKHWHFLFGNHESLLLDAFDDKHPIYGDYYLWWNQGGKETLESFKRWEPDEYQRSIMQPKDLLTHNYLKFLRNLETYWETEKYFFVHAGLFDVDIEAHKTKLAEEKGDGSEGSMKYAMVWMREPFISSKFDWGKKIIFGHTIDFDGRYQPQGGRLKPIIKKNKIGIDTMAHNVGKLTAVILPDETFVESYSTE